MNKGRKVLNFFAGDFPFGLFFISIENLNVALPIVVLPIQKMNLHSFLSISWSSDSRKLPIYIR